MSSTNYINAAATSKTKMSSTFSGPSLEENDDNRQAVKPSVSIFVEDTLYIVSDTNTSTSSETNTCYNKFLKWYHLPLLSQSITLNDFIKHLYQNLFFDLIKISVSETKTLMTYFFSFSLTALKTKSIQLYCKH